VSLSGTRGLIRISINPDCQLQSAMVVANVHETEFYQQYTGKKYPGEYGERFSARRRGSKFESNLHINNAALLRRALGPKYGWDPDVMTVRNFADELPGTITDIPGQRPSGIRAKRLYRTRQILRDLAAGRDVPHILIQPQLQLQAERAGKPYMFVSPDFMVLDARVNMYIPGEEKSFIVRDGVAERSDLDRTRRQAAAQILALREEATRVKIGDRVENRAVFVFATPYGLSPAAPTEEYLDAPMREIEHAIEALVVATRQYAARQSVDGASLAMMADEIPIHFQDSCFGSCVLAMKCKERFAGQTRELGDGATEAFGDVPIERIVELIRGAAPTTTAETELVPRLRDAQRVLRRIA
jgi:hypothetical protein